MPNTTKPSVIGHFNLGSYGIRLLLEEGVYFVQRRFGTGRWRSFTSFHEKDAAELAFRKEVVAHCAA